MQKYLNRISGPLLDRIDLHVEVSPVSFDAIADAVPAESSVDIRKRVVEAREVQTERFAGLEGMYSNAQMHSRQLREVCALDKESREMLKLAIEKLSLSGRAYDRILKVARTIADLEQATKIRAEHLAEAVQYRSLDRETWFGV